MIKESDLQGLMGPPAPGPIVNIQAPGIYLHLQVNDEIDLQILRLVIARAEQRRYVRAYQPKGNELYPQPTKE